MTSNNPNNPCSRRRFFDVDYTGRYIATGTESGETHIYDLNRLSSAPTPSIEASGTTSGLTPVIASKGHQDHVNGVSFHPYFSKCYPYLATCSGQRRFNDYYDPAMREESSSDESEADSPKSGRLEKESEGSKKQKQPRVKPEVVDNSICYWQVSETMCS